MPPPIKLLSLIPYPSDLSKEYIERHAKCEIVGRLFRYGDFDIGMTQIQNQYVWVAVWNSTAPDGAFTDKVENLSELLDTLDQAMIDQNSIHKISGVTVEYTINQIGLNIYLKAEGEGNWIFYDLIPMSQPAYYQNHLEQFKEFMRKKGIHVTSIKQRQD